MTVIHFLPNVLRRTAVVIVAALLPDGVPTLSLIGDGNSSHHGTRRFPENAEDKASRKPLDVTDHGTHTAGVRRYQDKVDVVTHDHIREQPEAMLLAGDRDLVEQDLTGESIAQEWYTTMRGERDESRPAVVIPMSELYHSRIPGTRTQDIALVAHQ